MFVIWVLVLFVFVRFDVETWVTWVLKFGVGVIQDFGAFLIEVFATMGCWVALQVFLWDAGDCYTWVCFISLLGYLLCCAYFCLRFTNFWFLGWFLGLYVWFLSLDYWFSRFLRLWFKGFAFLIWFLDLR